MHRSWATYPNSTEKQACVKDLEHNIGLAFKISTWQKIEWASWRMSYCLRQLFGHRHIILSKKLQTITSSSSRKYWTTMTQAKKPWATREQFPQISYMRLSSLVSRETLGKEDLSRSNTWKVEVGITDNASRINKGLFYKERTTHNQE